MTLHDLITLMILPIGTSGTNEIQYMKYTSEYIPKLQIHQHLYHHSIITKEYQNENIYFVLAPLQTLQIKVQLLKTI